MSDDYNYSVFDLANEEPHFWAFRDRLHVGERAPDGELEDLQTGDTVRLSSLWTRGVAVLEFGSFT